MIKYTVRCGEGHEFEGWFKDSASFDVQSLAGDIECPMCGNVDVVKAPMAPSIAKKGRVTPNQTEARAREVAEKILEAVNTMREHVEDNCDYVGEQFASEARRIHYGDADERGIYGEASDDETEELLDEGIEVYRLPKAPKGKLS